MSPALSWANVLFRLALGFSAGLLIGLDRGEHAHPVGLRTTILVSVAATEAMIQANWLLVHTVDTQISIVRLDMMRLPLGILSELALSAPAQSCLGANGCAGLPQRQRCGS